MGRKYVALLIGAALLMTAYTPILAKEPTTSKVALSDKTLTLNEAIKKAQIHSIQLKQNERAYELNKEKTDFAFNSGIYELWAINDSNLSYTQKQKGILEEQIALDVTKSFEGITAQIQQLHMLKEQQNVQEKLYLKAEIEFKAGRKSTLSLEQGTIDLQKTQDAIHNLEKDLELSYSKLGTMVGMNVTGYVLEVPSYHYEPFSTKLTLDQFSRSSANDHIAVWRAAEQVKIAYLPIYTNDYMELINQLENRKQAEDQQELTIQQLEEQIRRLYVETQKLQADYDMLFKQVELGKKEIEASRIRLENGMISQLDYDQQVLGLMQNEMRLDQMLTTQVNNVKLLKKPYLISSVGGF
ncbi:MAG: TolC family protein [Cellulosilyticaceae bacterium]